MQAVLRGAGSHGCKEQLRYVNATGLRLDPARDKFKGKIGFSAFYCPIKGNFARAVRNALAGRENPVSFAIMLPLLNENGK